MLSKSLGGTTQRRGIRTCTGRASPEPNTQQITIQPAQRISVICTMRLTQNRRASHAKSRARGQHNNSNGLQDRAALQGQGSPQHPNQLRNSRECCSPQSGAGPVEGRPLNCTTMVRVEQHLCCETTQGQPYSVHVAQGRFMLAEAAGLNAAGTAVCIPELPNCLWPVQNHEAHATQVLPATFCRVDLVAADNRHNDGEAPS